MENTYRGQFEIQHGEAVGKKTVEYHSWCHMKARCYDPNHPKFKDYGDRGIIVCERWLSSYEDFLEDMGRKPSKKHTLGRKDNDGNYYPENCEWQLPTTQARNRRTNKLKLVEVREIRMLYNGRGYTQPELAKEFGVSQAMISEIVNNKSWIEEI